MALLRRLWVEWSGIVDTLARGNDVEITGDEYRTLYRSLMAAVRGAVDVTPGQFKRLESVIEPWVTLAAIMDLDRVTCKQLLRTCRKIDAGVWPESVKSARPRWGLSLACGLCGLVVGAAVVLGSRGSVVKSLGAAWPVLVASVVTMIAISIGVAFK